MRLLRVPGVYRPQADTWLLARAAAEAALPAWPRVLDPYTGTGALAITAAGLGARSVTAVDISRRAIAAARINSRRRGITLELVRGDFSRSLKGRRFDVVLANPPYVPGPHPYLSRGASRAWDAGHHGRAALDVLCARLPAILAFDGVALIVHSTMCGEERTLRDLHASGLEAATVARAITPFGPVLRARARELENAGLIDPGQRSEELIVIRVDRALPSRRLDHQSELTARALPCAGCSDAMHGDQARSQTL